MKKKKKEERDGAKKPKPKETQTASSLPSLQYLVEHLQHNDCLSFTLWHGEGEIGSSVCICCICIYTIPLNTNLWEGG